MSNFQNANVNEVKAAIRQAVRDLLINPPSGATLDTLVDTAFTAARSTNAAGAAVYTDLSIMCAVLSQANVDLYGTRMGALEHLVLGG